jgi:hypothetical protein
MTPRRRTLLRGIIEWRFAKGCDRRWTMDARCTGFTVFGLLACLGTAQARHIESWPDDKLSRFSDLVVVAREISTFDAPRDIGNKLPKDDFLKPVLTTLEVLHVLKGTYTDRKLVVLHNRLDLRGRMLMNGPILVEFNTSETYVLFLKLRPGGHYYEPVPKFDSGLSQKRAAKYSAPNTSTVEKLWSDLSNKDAITVYKAIRGLVSSRSKAMSLFEQRVKPIRHVDGNRLDELLHNLNSDKFRVRQQAAKELEALGQAAEPALRRALAAPSSEEVRQRASRLLSQLASEQWRGSRVLEILESMNDPEARRLLTSLAHGAPRARLTTEAQAALDRLAKAPSPAADEAVFRVLLEDYKAYGLPMPPADSTLALLPSPSSTKIDGVWRSDMHVVLLLKQASPKKPARYWIGCDEGRQWYRTEFRPVAPKRASLDNTVSVPGDLRGRGYPTYPDLALAIQCFARGWDELAAPLLVRSREPPPEKLRSRNPPRPAHDRAALAELAWNHYCNQFVERTTERKAIVAQMKKLLASPHELNTPAHKNIVADMEKTLGEVKTAPGSLEAAVEALLDFKDTDSTWPGAGWGDFRNYAHWHPNYKKLRDAGLLAVPVLIQHINDYRLTRTMATKKGRYTWHIRIADVAARLLNGLVSEPFTYDFLEEEGRGRSLDRRHVEAWWKEVRGQKELDFLLNGVYRQSERTTRPEPNEAVLHVLGARFPQELVKLFEQEFRNGKADDTWFTTLLESTAPKEMKAGLFIAAAQSKDEWNQILALRALTRMKHPEATPLVIKALDAQPKTPEETYWFSNIRNFAQIVTWSNDERAWDGLLKTARRVDVGQRMEILGYAGHQKKKLAIRFLRSFLDDSEIRDRSSSKLFEGFCAAHEFQRIAVRDYAAMLLAETLGIEVEPSPTWKEEDWRKLRERVAAAKAKREDKDSRQ